MSKKITKRGRYMMKVLMLNGSPRTKGNTFIALEEMKKVFEVEGVEAEIVQVGNKDVRGCIACRRCVELGKCVFDDVVNEMATKFEAADGLVLICVDGFPLGWAQKRGGQLKNKYNPGWRWQ